jgi:hypothetical protein
MSPEGRKERGMRTDGSTFAGAPTIGFTAENLTGYVKHDEVNIDIRGPAILQVSESVFRLFSPFSQCGDQEMRVRLKF